MVLPEQSVSLAKIGKSAPLGLKAGRQFAEYFGLRQLAIRFDTIKTRTAVPINRWGVSVAYYFSRETFVDFTFESKHLRVPVKSILILGGGLSHGLAPVGESAVFGLLDSPNFRETRDAEV
jgi:hypothetical protein